MAITVPVDDGLARLLREGAHASRALSPTGHKMLRELASTAERRPAEGARSVQMTRPMMGVAADELAALLARARQDGDPAADALAAFAASEFGVSEPAPPGAV